MSHREHAKASELLGRVEHYRRESTWHLRIQADLDPRLYLVLTLDEQVKQFLCVHDSLSEVGHETDQSSVPLVRDLRECCRTASHQDLSDPVLKALDAIFIDPYESLRGDLLRTLIL